MRPTIKLLYWTRSEGDFDGIEQFKSELDQAYRTNILRQISDECGGCMSISRN